MAVASPVLAPVFIQPPLPPFASVVQSEHEKCPECKSILVRRNGCRECLSCGWSKCS